MNDVIMFYRAKGPYGCFSNLWRCDVKFEGKVFPTAEHAYQYAKPRKERVRDWLMQCPSASLLAVTAHALLPWDVAPGWSQVRHARMRAVVEAKFRQHPDLAHILLSTQDAELIESATVDNETNRRWGQVKGKGTNWLGKILMEVRAMLREEGNGDLGQPEWHPWFDSPLIREAMKERPPEDISVIGCDRCGSISYYNDGSHASCDHCNAGLDHLLDEAITLADHFDHLDEDYDMP